jgi:hypothetical protein
VVLVCPCPRVIGRISRSITPESPDTRLCLQRPCMACILERRVRGPSCWLEASPRPPQIRQGWPTRHYTADRRGHRVDQPDGLAVDIFLVLCMSPSCELPRRGTCCALYIASALMVKRKAAMRLARIDSSRRWYYSGWRQPQTVKLSKVSVRWYGPGRKPYQTLILSMRGRHGRREPGAARCCKSQRQARARGATSEMQTMKAAPTVAVSTLTSYGGQHHEVWAHVRNPGAGTPL